MGPRRQQHHAGGISDGPSSSSKPRHRCGRMGPRRQQQHAGSSSNGHSRSKAWLSYRSYMASVHGGPTTAEVRHSQVQEYGDDVAHCGLEPQRRGQGPQSHIEQQHGDGTSSRNSWRPSQSRSSSLCRGPTITDSHPQPPSAAATGRVTFPLPALGPQGLRQNLPGSTRPSSAGSNSEGEGSGDKVTFSEAAGVRRPARSGCLLDALVEPALPQQEYALTRRFSLSARPGSFRTALNARDGPAMSVTRFGPESPRRSRLQTAEDLPSRAVSLPHVSPWEDDDRELSGMDRRQERMSSHMVAGSVQDPSGTLVDLSQTQRPSADTDLDNSHPLLGTMVEPAGLPGGSLAAGSSGSRTPARSQAEQATQEHLSVNTARDSAPSTLPTAVEEPPKNTGPSLMQRMSSLRTADNP